MTNHWAAQLEFFAFIGFALWLFYYQSSSARRRSQEAERDAAAKSATSDPSDRRE